MYDHEYYLGLMPNLLTLELNKWWTIKQDRPDRENFLDAIKARIDYYNDFEFGNDYLKFRRIVPPKEQKPIRNIEFKLEWHINSYELNDKERNLPTEGIRKSTNEQWNKLRSGK